MSNDTIPTPLPPEDPARAKRPTDVDSIRVSANLRMKTLVRILLAIGILGGGTGTVLGIRAQDAADRVGVNLRETFEKTAKKVDDTAVKVEGTATFVVDQAKRCVTWEEFEAEQKRVNALIVTAAPRGARRQLRAALAAKAREEPAKPEPPKVPPILKKPLPPPLSPAPEAAEAAETSGGKQ